jgi:two-component system LytT family sensor kinase
MVPNMILQPLVENSIKHGLSPKIGGGSVNIRSRLEGQRLTLEVEDDGVGMAASSVADASDASASSGIGMANVMERLKVLYGDSYRMWIDSRPGEGTSTGIEIPEQVSGTVVGVESLVGSG